MCLHELADIEQSLLASRLLQFQIGLNELELPRGRSIV